MPLLVVARLEMNSRSCKRVIAPCSSCLVKDRSENALLYLIRQDQDATFTLGFESTLFILNLINGCLPTIAGQTLSDRFHAMAPLRN